MRLLIRFLVLVGLLLATVSTISYKYPARRSWSVPNEKGISLGLWRADLEIMLWHASDSSVPPTATSLGSFVTFKRYVHEDVFAFDCSAGAISVSSSEFWTSDGKQDIGAFTVIQNTLTLAMWPFVFLFLIWPVVSILLRSRSRHRQGLCRRCGYILYGLTEPRCPECGTAFEMNKQQKIETVSSNQAPAEVGP